MNMIIVTGCPGSGKTEISSFLKEKLDYPVISKDFYKEDLFEKHGFNDASEKKALDAKAEQLFYDCVNKHIDEDESIIVDKWLQTLDGFGDSVHKPNVNLIVVRLTCDYSILNERLNKRLEDPTRPESFRVKDRYPVIEGISTIVKEITIEETKEKASRPFSKEGIANYMEVDTSSISDNGQEAKVKILNFVMERIV